MLRRKSNLLLGMENKEGTWQMGSEEVETIVFYYVESMFKANAICVPETAIKVLDHKVTNEMNQRLTRVVTNDEVKVSSL
ncbi:hypothetical protein LIER_29841 [Lithospermum erythrorhizon]|uniref:Uncharacterized protein n=1 Tax=Lithospermum erythrorhizon TaxID=34254 RepID=A0AAV3RKX3_LITER